MTKGKKTFQPLESKHICRIYKILHQQGEVSFMIAQESESKVDALVGNILGSFGGQDFYKTTEEKCVAYLWFLVKDHAFTDGNKRTACMTFEIVCEANGLVPAYRDFTLDELAVYIAQEGTEEHQEVIKMLAELLFS